ncbi:MAG: hypothetical protein EBU70_15150, partial [Actinobacteria bacterium]|nr:hypothetical protein [Actinomycetota bacterium]
MAATNHASYSFRRLGPDAAPPQVRNPSGVDAAISEPSGSRPAIDGPVLPCVIGAGRPTFSMASTAAPLTSSARASTRVRVVTGTSRSIRMRTTYPRSASPSRSGWTSTTCPRASPPTVTGDPDSSPYTPWAAVKRTRYSAMRRASRLIQPQRRSVAAATTATVTM